VKSKILSKFKKKIKKISPDKTIEKEWWKDSSSDELNFKLPDLEDSSDELKKDKKKEEKNEEISSQKTIIEKEWWKESSSDEFDFKLPNLENSSDKIKKELDLYFSSDDDLNEKEAKISSEQNIMKGIVQNEEQRDSKEEEVVLLNKKKDEEEKQEWWKEEESNDSMNETIKKLEESIKLKAKKKEEKEEKKRRNECDTILIDKNEDDLMTRISLMSCDPKILLVIGDPFNESKTIIEERKIRKT